MDKIRFGASNVVDRPMHLNIDFACESKLPSMTLSFFINKIISDSYLIKIAVQSKNCIICNIVTKEKGNILQCGLFFRCGQVRCLNNFDSFDAFGLDNCAFTFKAQLNLGGICHRCRQRYTYRMGFAQVAAMIPYSQEFVLPNKRQTRPNRFRRPTRRMVNGITAYLLGFLYRRWQRIRLRFEQAFTDPITTYCGNYV